MSLIPIKVIYYLPHLIEQLFNIVNEGIEFPLKNFHTFLEESLGQLTEHGELSHCQHGRLHSKEGVIIVGGFSGQGHNYAVLKNKINEKQISKLKNTI